MFESCFKVRIIWHNEKLMLTNFYYQIGFWKRQWWSTSKRKVVLEQKRDRIRSKSRADGQHWCRFTAFEWSWKRKTVAKTEEASTSRAWRWGIFVSLRPHNFMSLNLDIHVIYPRLTCWKSKAMAVINDQQGWPLCVCFGALVVF